VSGGDLALEHDRNAQGTNAPASVELPAPTAWPIVLAFGLALLFGGLLTSAAVSTLGAILTVAGCVGWFRQVLPHERHETVPLAASIGRVLAEDRRRPQVCDRPVALRDIRR